MLFFIECDLIVVRDLLCRERFLKEKAGYYPPLKYVFFNYLSDILRLYAGIESSLRIDDNKGTSLAESVTSCFNKAYFFPQLFCL